MRKPARAYEKVISKIVMMIFGSWFSMLITVRWSTLIRSMMAIPMKMNMMRENEKRDIPKCFPKIQEW
jgi:hypothetical protein